MAFAVRVLLSLFVVVACTTHAASSSTGQTRQEQAFEKLKRGERLTSAEVDDLAGRSTPTGSSEPLTVGNYFCCCGIPLLLVAVGIWSGLEGTRRQERIAVHRKLDSLRHQIDQGLKFRQFEDVMADLSPNLGRYLEKHSDRQACDSSIVQAWEALKEARDLWKEAPESDPPEESVDRFRRAVANIRI